MVEKVLYVKLPEGSTYRRSIVTDDGMIGIVYSEEECHIPEEIPEEIVKVEIPKPNALVGGGEVYQNDDVPYWFCKIKGGRDTFMHVYMEDLTEKDLLYDSRTGRKREFSTNVQKKFKEEVLKALKNKPEEGFRWIPTFEPSLEQDGNLQFVRNAKPLVSMNCFEWKEKMEKYSPENESCMSSKTTYFLLLLRWLKDGVASLEQLTVHSEEIGHYWDSDNSNHYFENSGQRKHGGLCGFVGNTCKIVVDLNTQPTFSLLGGSFLDVGDKHPLAHINFIKKPVNKQNFSVGLLELKK